MRIAFVCAPTANMIRPSYLGRYLVRRGHEVHVVVPPSAREPFLYGMDQFPITIHRCPAGGRALAEVGSRLRHLVPDLVHCMDTGRAGLPPTLWYGRRRRALTLVDVPDWMSRGTRLRAKFLRLLEYQALQRADAVALASQELLEYYQRGRHRARLYYLPFAADLEFIEAHRAGAAQVRARYGDLKLLTYLGTLRPEYDPRETLALARALSRRRRDFRLLFVGSGPLEEELAATAAAWGLSDLVEFLGFVPEDQLPGLLTASDVLLCPLADNVINRTRCPNKVFWCLGARRPIVANQVGEAALALGDEALYYRYGDVEDGADQVERALAGAAPIPSPERLAAHSWPAVADRYERLLADLTGA